MLNMTRKRLAAMAFRWSMTAVFVLWVFARSAPGQRAPATAPVANVSSISGVYNGSYAGEQGPIKFKLSITQQDNGTLAGELTLYLPEGSDTKAYACDLRGRYVPVNRMVQLIRGKWINPPPGRFDMPGMNGVFDPDGGNGAGQISGKMRLVPAQSSRPFDTRLNRPGWPVRSRTRRRLERQPHRSRRRRGQPPPSPPRRLHGLRRLHPAHRNRRRLCRHLRIQPGRQGGGQNLRQVHRQRIRKRNLRRVVHV